MGAGTTRRRVLAGSVAVFASAGCLSRFRRASERQSPSQLELEIRTLPEDEDSYALRISRHLEQTLEDAGISVNILPTRHTNFLRETLINGDFDMYVWRHPFQRDPDILRPLLHSRFAEETGWQNPFNFSNSVVDDSLIRQLTSATDRTRVLAEVQHQLIQERPFIPIGFQHDTRVVAPDYLEIDETRQIGDPSWILGLTPGSVVDQDLGEEPFECRLGTTDWRMTHNLNPLAVEYRGKSGITGLFYEPLARWIDGSYRPWLAEEWEWTSDGSTPTMDVRLRSNLRWNDGERLTAADVVFTYRFLQDTTMTDDDPNVPAPRFRGRSSLIDSVELLSNHQIRIQFVEASLPVAEQVVTIPILPEHIWIERTEPTQVGGITLDDMLTEALVAENLEPVGSGPYVVEGVTTDEELRVSRNEAYRLAAVDESFVPAIDELVFDIRPSASNIVSAVESGSLHAAMRDIGRAVRENDWEPSNGVTLIESPTSRLYHVGFNLREAPFSNRGFREAIAKLVDQEFVYTAVFQNVVRPTHSPVHDEQYVPSDLQYSSDEEHFVGENGTGEIDVEAARDLFREAGFQYSEDGKLLSR